MLKLQINIILSLICTNLFAQTIIYENIDTIRTKHFYRNIITKSEKIISYPIDSFFLQTIFCMDNEIIEKIETSYSIKNNLLTVYSFDNCCYSWQIYNNDTNNIILQLLPIENNGSTTFFYTYSILDVIHYYEYKEYEKNKILNTLKSNRYKICETFGEIYDLKDSILKIETLNENQVWTIKNKKDSVYNYILERLTENKMTEICKTNSLIPFIALNTIRCKNGIIIKDIYEKNEKILDTLTGQIEPIYLVTDEMPQFPGGDDALKKAIIENLDFNFSYPESIITNTVFVRFVVTKNGEIKNVYVVRGVSQEMDEIAFYSVSRLPKFIPGKQNGEYANVWYTVPVKFELY